MKLIKEVYQLQDGDKIITGDYAKISEAFLMTTTNAGKTYHSKFYRPMFRFVDKKT